MLEEAGMSKGFWPAAHQYSNHVHNRSPTSALTRATPYEVFYNNKPNISTLCVFGSRCHVCLPKDKHRKLDAHSLDCILCGFAHRSKAYKVWIPSRHKFKTSRDVIVYEKIPEHDEEPVITSASSEGVTQDESASSKGFTKAPTIIEESRPPAEPPPTIPEIPSIAPETLTPTQPTPMQTVPADVPAPPPIPVQPCHSEHTIRPTWVKAAADAEKSHEIEVKATNKALRNAHAERRELKARARAEAESQDSQPQKPTSEQEVAHLAYMAAHRPDTPLSYHDAVKSPQANEWHIAMEEEFNLLTE
jgi:hypothetical protein